MGLVDRLFENIRAKDAARAAEWAERGVLYESNGYTDGCTETFTVYFDRVEWTQHAKTRALVFKADRASETIPIGNVTSCEIRKGGRSAILQVHSAGGAITFQVARTRAEEGKKAVLEAMALANSKPPAPNVAEELSKLNELVLQGVLTSDEWDRAKALYLGKAADRRTEDAALLMQLHSLHRAGALSESEFNTKKWEILSRN